MGLAQMLLTITAISLLGTITLTLNSSYLTTNGVMYESEFTIEAIAVAESFLELAQSKKFDEATVNKAVSSTSGLSLIGRDSGEDPNTLSHNDDFDDFDGHQDIYTTDRASYNVSIQVVYVDDTNPNSPSGTKTLFKKMRVTVGNMHMKIPVSMDYIFGYF